MSAPTASRNKANAKPPTPSTVEASTDASVDAEIDDQTETVSSTRTIRAGRVVTDDVPLTKPAKVKTGKTGTGKATTRPSTKAPKAGAKAPAGSTKGGKKTAATDVEDAAAAKQARRAERLRLAEADLAKDEATAGRFGTKTQWLVGAVLGVLVFQIVHSAEHVAQSLYWLFNPTVAPWMSTWAMGLASGLTSISGGTPALGMELLHLIGNGIFLAGLLLAFKLPEQYKNPQTMRWLRLATIVQALHFLEHVLLTVSVAGGGKAIGLSTMFGLMTAGTPAAAGYRVFFHLVVNLIALVLTVKAYVAYRDKKLADSGRTPTGFDWRRSAIMFAPLAGVIFLIPIFGGVVPAASADDATVATVNGVAITNGQLQAEVEAVSGQQSALTLDPATSAATGVEAQGQQNTDPAMMQFIVLNSLVQAEIIEQGAAAMGVTVTEAEVEARRTKLIEESFLGQVNYEKFLASNNVSPEYATEQVRRLLLEERVQQQLTAGFVAPADIVQTEYATKYEGFPQARHLLTTSRDQAEVYLAQVEGGADFDEMVRTLSTDPRAATQGGDMGTIRDGAQVPEVVEAINGMQDGEYSIVQTQFGWHVIQRLAPPSLADVEPEIRQGQLLIQMGTVGQEWIAQLRAAAQVGLTEGFGVWDTQFGAVVAPAGGETPAGLAPAEGHGHG